jgi:hypothetical protein
VSLRWIFEQPKPPAPLVLEIGRCSPLLARDSRIPVSHDRETMPAHFAAFISESTSAGLLIVSQNLEIGQTIDQILLVWAASEAREWSNRIGYLPF